MSLFRSSFDVSVFADLERLQLELSRMQDNYNSEVGQLLEFRRKTADEVQRMWDSVNELQETANVTARHVEDIYDKDVLRLQDFRSSAEGELTKLREEVGTLSSKLSGSGVAAISTSAQSGNKESSSLSSLDSRLSSVESEIRALRTEASAATAAGAAVRQELQGVFADVDALEESHQDAAREILMLERAVAEMEEGPMEDLLSRVDRFEDRFENIDHFRSGLLLNIMLVPTLQYTGR